MNRVIKLERSSTRKKILLANDLVPAGILLLTGINSLSKGTEGTLALINVVSGGVLVFFGLKEWRSLTLRVRGSIQWYDIASGAVLLFNAVTMYKTTKGFQPAHLFMFAALLLFLKGLSIIRPTSPFRRLTITDTGFTLKTNPISTHRFTWSEVNSIEIRERTLYVTTTNGDRKISLKNIEETEEMEHVLREGLRKSRA